MRDKQHLGCLRVRDGVITLEKLFFHDEIRPVEEICAPEGEGAEGGTEDGDRADRAVHDGTFEPERYEDTYRKALLKVIKAKQKGETITADPAAEDEEPADLLAALKASVEAAKKSRGSVRKRPPARKKPATRRKTAKR